MTLAHPDPRATAWCAACRENLPVRYIMRISDQQPEYPYGRNAASLPKDARYIRGRLHCGHEKAVITTVDNVACMREHIASGRELM